MIDPLDNRSVHCTNCNQVLAEDYRQPELPCPHCGSIAREFSVELVDTVEVLESLRMKGFRAGMSRNKGLFVESVSRLEAQWDRGGAIAHVAYTVDKDRNPTWYTETVTMRDTGEVIRHCSEPLPQHQNRGAAKVQKACGD